MLETCEWKRTKRARAWIGLIHGNEFDVEETSKFQLPPSPSEANSDEGLSVQATRGIFGWMIYIMRYPACEKRIYQHSWFDFGSDSDEKADDDDDDDDLAHYSSESVERWLEELNINDMK